MMKFILLVSLVLNVAFIYRLKTGEQEALVEDRISLQSAQRARPVATSKASLPSYSKTPPELKVKASETQEQEIPDLPPEVEDFVSLADRMELERQDFLENELALDEDTINKYRMLKFSFQEYIHEFYKNPAKEPTFEERRKMLTHEEEFHRSLSAMFGPQKWEEYQKYRQDFNQRMFEKHQKDNAPFFLMEL